MLREIKRYVQKQYFFPDILGVLINPVYLVRRALAEDVKKSSPLLTGKVLDVGCGSKPYQPLLTHSSSYVGMEYDTPANRARAQADIFYDGECFPFPDSSFESVVATEVLEHVFNPDQFLSEVHRVLKKDGVFFLSCPFMWIEHQKPYDYARYSSFGVSHLVTAHGFKILTQKKNVSGVLALTQLFTSYLRKKIIIKNYAARLCIYALFIGPWTVLGLAFSVIFPKESDLYIDNVLLVQKI